MQETMMMVSRSICFYNFLSFIKLIVGLFGEITYSLVGEQSKNFQIEQDSGIIIVINSTVLDRETYSEISLTGIASDKGPVTTRKSNAVPVCWIINNNCLDFKKIV